MFDLIIKKGMAVLPDAVEMVDIAVKNGVIAAMAPTIDERAAREINALRLHLCGCCAHQPFRLDITRQRRRGGPGCLLEQVQAWPAGLQGLFEYCKCCPDWRDDPFYDQNDFF